jgi:hypothetical protein
MGDEAGASAGGADSGSCLFTPPPHHFLQRQNLKDLREQVFVSADSKEFRRRTPRKCRIQRS